MQLSTAINNRYLKIKNKHSHHYSENNDVTYLQSGNDFFNELESLIAEAKYFIHLQTYILDNDIVGSRVIQSLINKVKEGVVVYLILDGYGSGSLSKSFIKNLKEEGIHFKFFSPLHSSLKFKIGRRLHHKILLVDGICALVGGINIAEKYKGNKQVDPWLDFAVKVQGNVCKDILKICEDVWGRKLKKKNKRMHVSHFIDEHGGEMKVKLLQNDWLRGNIEISTFYRQNIRNAKHSITIVASYFLPGIRILKLLRKAAQRGVRIAFIVPGKSDVGLMKQATNYLYPFFMRHQINVQEWQPSVMHGKLMIVDDEITTIGSYNLNSLSDYGSLELNVCVDDIEFTKMVQGHINSLIKDHCMKINPADYEQQHHWWNQAFNWISYQLIRIALKVVFVFMRY